MDLRGAFQVHLHCPYVNHSKGLRHKMTKRMESEKPLLYKILTIRKKKGKLDVAIEIKSW